VAVEAQPVRVELTPAEVAAAQLKETRRLPVLAAKGATEKATPAGLAPGVPRRISQWVRKLNPFRWRSHHRPAGTAVPPARHRSPVQGELSLDKIKVVRNDLTDADLEIVSAGEASKRNPAPVAGAKPGVALAWLRPR
jgi:hypothetical protein